MSPKKKFAVIRGLSSQVIPLAVTSDSTVFVPGLVNGSIIIWDIQTWEKNCTITGHLLAVTSLAITGNILISSSSDMSFRCWDIESRVLLSRMLGHEGLALCFAENSIKTLVVAFHI